MATKKILTKREAMQAGYYIAQAIVSRKRKMRGITATFLSEWLGNWHETAFEIDGPDFSISAKRWKHRDGRIRDVSEYIDGEIDFAIFAVKHFPDAHSHIADWADALRDRTRVARSIETSSARKIFLEFGNPSRFSFKALLDDINVATTLAKVAA